MKKICVYILSVLMFSAVNLPILAQTVSENDIQDIAEYSVKKLEIPKNKYYYGFNYYAITIKNNSQNPLEITGIQYPKEFKDYFSKQFYSKKESVKQNLKSNSKLLLYSPAFVILGVLAIIPTSLIAIIGFPSTGKGTLDRGFLVFLPEISLFGIFSPIIFTGEIALNLSDKLTIKNAYKNLNENYYVGEFNQKLIIYPEKSIKVALLGGVYYRGHTDVNIEIKDVKNEKIYTETIILNHR